jgi:adenine-specific DNA-methyltransferase
MADKFRTPEKMDLRSMDIREENRAKLKQLFPSVVTETRNEKGDLAETIDFEKLKAELGKFSDVFESRRERYGMDWPGKKDCMKLIQQSSIGTLKPCREESVNFDATENLFIEGDNLEVLKLLQKSYYGKVKVICIDPPYNTGNEFIYPDNFSESLETYLEYAGQKGRWKDSQDANSKENPRHHTRWLNMMSPRLYLARNLLRDDGVIFIHIDDNEVSNLRKLCDEILGEENFRNCILTRRRIKSLNSQFAQSGLRSMNIGFEYVLVYAKNEYFLMKPLRMKKANISTKGRWDVFWSNADRPTMRYDILGFAPKSGQWRYSQEKALNAIENYRKYLAEYSDKISLEEYWESNGCNMQFVRRIPDGVGKNGGVQHWVPPSDTALRTSVWMDIEVSQIKKEIDLPFDNPKSKELLIELVKLASNSNDIILDFFSGSCTAAHAVLDLNKEDNGNRKFIMVQLPEPCAPESEAFKAGYKTIADIGKERIRRVIKKIEAEQASKAKEDASALPGMAESPPKLDLGFKVFKLDKSNFKLWDGADTNVSEEKLARQLELHIDHINPKASPEDVLYELLLKAGFKPTEKVAKKKLAGKTVFSIAGGGLLICLEDNITRELIDAVAEAEPIQFICLDRAFNGNDQLKANAVQTFEARNQGRDKTQQIVFRTV